MVKKTISICLNDAVPALQNDNKCAPKIQFTVHHAETKRRCHKVSASDVFRCAESSARAGAPKLCQQFLVFGMFLFGAPKNSKLAISLICCAHLFAFSEASVRDRQKRHSQTVASAECGARKLNFEMRAACSRGLTCVFPASPLSHSRF